MTAPRLCRWGKALTLCGGLLIICSEVRAIEPSPSYPAIQQAFLREEFPLVVAHARGFLAQHPDSPEAARVWLWLALSLDRLQRSNESLSEFDLLKSRVGSTHPLWTEILFWEADVSRRALQMIRAKLVYEQLISDHPRSTWTVQARYGLGLVYLHQQAFQYALGCFHEVAFGDSETPLALDALMLEGLCYLRLERFKEAIAVFEPLTEQLREPAGRAQAGLYLGESFTGLEGYDDAIRAYKRAIAASDGSRWAQLAHFGIGWAHWKASQCRESIDAFERYLAQNLPEHRSEALYAQGLCLRKTGLEHEALARFEQVAAHDPGHPLAVECGLLVIDSFRRQERFAQAKGLIHTLLSHQPSPAVRAQLQLRLGAIALEQGNPAQAKTVFSLAADPSGDLAVRQAAFNGLGDVYMFVGDLAKAKQSYGQALQVSERTALADSAAHHLARIHLQLGSIGEAMTILHRLTQNADPAVADEARLMLVVAHLSQGEQGLARFLVETIRRRHPDSAAAARAAYYQALIALGEQDEALAQQLCQEVIMKAPDEEEAIDARLLLAELRLRSAPVRGVMTWLEEEYASGRLRRGQRAKLAKRLGDLARSEQDYIQAIKWYDEAADLLPAFEQETLYRSASCYEEAGDTEVALRLYRQIRQPPWQVRGQLALAKLLEREDRSAEARLIYASLAATAAPEARVAQERLAALGQTSGRERE